VSKHIEQFSSKTPQFSEKYFKFSVVPSLAKCLLEGFVLTTLFEETA